MAKILDSICKPNDIKNVPSSKYPALASEIRQFLLENVSRTGGHLASNLGVVELTMALHLCMDFPQDKIVWDVGHQSYIHKILTGRKEGFGGLRTYGGISGFPKAKESECDAFDTGHSSTSISAALGIARGRDLLNEDYTVAAVIGDGSLTGGMAYEAINNAARMDKNFIIILNDNNMSISENVGGISKHLNNIRTNQSYLDLKNGVENALRKIPKVGNHVARTIKRSKDSIKQMLVHGGLFESLGVDYMGPVDGHDINQLVKVISAAKQKRQAVLIHVITQKGKGYAPAEADPSAFHGVGKFDVKTGEPLSAEEDISYTKVFSNTMLELAEENSKIVGVCAAMPYGTGLHKFSKKYPKRFFDVGIAEEHAVTFAAGLAASGMKPYVAIYSSFLQRAYDQMIHDVCLPQHPVVFCIDRAGIVGADGETHQGILDLSYLASIPGMTVFAPKNRFELEACLRFAADFDAPLAIRYPRGSAYEGLKEFNAPIGYGKSELLYEGKDVALLAVGSMVEVAVSVREKLKSHGICATVVNARFVKPIDVDCIQALAKSHKLLVTMEENILRGGFGEHVDAYLTSLHDDKKEPLAKVLNIGIPDVYVEHGNVTVLKEKMSLDAVSVTDKILEEINGL